jgi:hypothetical protein
MLGFERKRINPHEKYDHPVDLQPPRTVPTQARS